MIIGWRIGSVFLVLLSTSLASAHELAAAIAKLIRDPERLRAMGRRGRYRAEVDFGEDKYLESHLRLIRGDE